ncbi:MAG: DUF2061 domain-containing protein [Saprospiraceae bacterium]|nr:DUF2061 domain-containing protein [Saprospiraceae bacterium]
MDHPQGNVPEKAPQKESHLRSVIKSVSWRIVGSIDTMLLSYLFTGSVKIAALIGSTEVMTKVILYYMHERIWQIIPRNTVRHWFKSKKS